MPTITSKKAYGQKWQAMKMNNYYKVAAKMNEAAEHYKHRPRATKYSTTKFYNFNNKRKGARKNERLQRRI